MRWKHFFWLCLLAALRCQAAIFQWTDAAGTVHFSDRPPQERMDIIERRDIESRTPSAPPPVLHPRVAAPAKVRHDRARKPTHRTTRSTKREQTRRRCEQLRRHIAVTQSQLRAGYSARRGIRLTERLRADRDVFYHDCR